jgi:hypothetical protein
MIDERIIEIYRQDNLNAATVRAVRNSLLADTDYLGLSDCTMTNEMAGYRQALRDLPSLSSWPVLDIDAWPIKPEGN